MHWDKEKQQVTTEKLEGKIRELLKRN